MRVLITGAAGQLGSELQATAPEGVRLSALPRMRLDLTRRDEIERALDRIEPEVTINAAAYTAVDRAEDERDRAFAVNATGAGWLAEAVAHRGGRLVHASTDFVFAGDGSRPWRPDDPTEPLSVYGESKRRGEVEVARAAGDTAVIVRTSWLYSRFGGNFVKTVLRLLAERETVRVVADQVGSPTWARRLAQAIWELAPRPELTGVFHWADTGTASWYDLAVAVRDEATVLGLLESPASVMPIASEEFGAKATRPAFSVLDCEATWEVVETEPWPWRRSLRVMLSELSA